MLTPPKVPPMMGPSGTELSVVALFCISVVADENAGGVVVDKAVSELVVWIWEYDELVDGDVEDGGFAYIVSRVGSTLQPTWR
jgi:hypothetical protein